MRAWSCILTIFLGLTGVVALTDGAHGGATGVNDATAVSASIAYLQARASQWGIHKAAEEFRARRVTRDTLGQTHVRLDQIHQGVPVFGRQLIVHLDPAGTPKSATGAYLAGITASTQPVISDQDAQAVARRQFPGQITQPPAVDLVLYPVNGSARLAYRVVLKDDQTPRRVVAFVDAITGVLFHSYNDLRSLAPLPIWPSSAGTEFTTGSDQRQAPTVAAAGIGNSLYSGTVTITTDSTGGTFEMVDPTRGGLYTTDKKNRRFGLGSGQTFTDTDNVWGNGTNNDRATAGVDAHFGAGLTWDYFLSVHGRDGIRDDGVGSLSRVHFKSNYNNAFWDDGCFCMTYGDGDGTTFTPLVSIDVAGHEMTHGVTSNTADLIYDNQAGGLNEAISDIFGAMVEFYAAAHGVAKTPNYLIGEDVFTPGTPGDALRYMANPTQDGQSIDTFQDYNDSLDVHNTSGIANNAFYLLAEGGTHRLGGLVTGIGRSAAERIFYRALSVYMAPSETFSEARADTTQAAVDLFGAGSQEVISVGQAWSAVGVQ